MSVCVCLMVLGQGIESQAGAWLWMAQGGAMRQASILYESLHKVQYVFFCKISDTVCLSVSLSASEIQLSNDTVTFFVCIPALLQKMVLIS